MPMEGQHNQTKSSTMQTHLPTEKGLDCKCLPAAAPSCCWPTNAVQMAHLASWHEVNLAGTDLTKPS